MRNQVETQDFTPYLLAPTSAGARFAAVMIEVDICPSCRRIMVTVDDIHRHPFPQWRAVDLNEQLRRAGWVVTGDGRQPDGQPICRDCTTAGKARFLCALCGHEQPTDQIEQCFGDPPDYLCKTCYTTVPAAEWDTIKHRLWEEHRYDDE